MRTLSNTEYKIIPLIYILPVFIFSCGLLLFAAAFSETFSKVVNVAEYLAWHNLFEFCAIFVSFAIFIVTFYTFNQIKKLKPMILGNTFLAVGILDLAHTLSFKGMPTFLITNSDPNRATTFWIIARLAAGIGFLITSFICPERSIRSGKKRMLWLGLMFCAAAFIIVTYYPDVLPPMYIEGIGLTQTKVILEYAAILLFLAAAAMFLVRYYKNNDILAIHITVALLLSAFSEYAFINYSAVYDIYNYIGHIYKFLAYFLFFRVAFIKSVQQPYIQLSKAQDELKDYAEHLDKLVEQRTAQLKDTNQMLLNDLDYARDIQAAMLPKGFHGNGRINFAARYFPAGKVSGDFYNYFMMDEDNVVMYIGDVSGHGVPAAMLTVFINQCIKVGSAIVKNSLGITRPSLVLSHLYESYNNTNFKDDLYIVLIYGVYSISRNTLTYASAGINVSPLLVRPGGEIVEFPVKGFPLCKLREYYSAEYEDLTIDLGPGDKVVFYTDGLTEPEDADGKMFTAKSLNDILASCRNEDSRRTAAAIESSLAESVDIENPKDDITYFVMEVK